MLEVEIRNFQSIEHAVVRIDGFTALVGRSNIGKSAIIRAIKAALTGAPADAFVRHDALCPRLSKGTKSCKCSCSVHLRGDSVDLLWEKGDDKNRYVYNGQEYTVPGRGTPDFLEDRFGLVKVGDQKVLLQIADQFRHSGGGPIFLLDESGSVVADVLSDVAQLDRINVAIRLAEKDRREAVASRKVRERDLMDLKIQAAAFDGLDAALGRIREVEADEAALDSRRTQRDRLQRFRDSVLTVGRQVKSLVGALAVEVPENTLGSAKQRITNLEHFIASLGVKTMAVDALVGIERVEPPSIDPVVGEARKFARLGDWLTKLRSFKALFARWKDVEDKEVPAVATLVEAASKAQHLAGLNAKLVSLENALAKLETAFNASTQERDAVQAEVDGLGACPTCARPIIDGSTHDHAAE